MTRCYSGSFVLYPQSYNLSILSVIFMVMRYLGSKAPQTISALSSPPQSSILTVEYIHPSQQLAMQIQFQTYRKSAEGTRVRTVGEDGRGNISRIP